jgi:DNA-binding PadR family transcriptional regulator
MKKFRESVVKALLPHIVLQEASKQPIHGYGLISLLRRRYGVYFGASTVYPVLCELERQGLIQSRWEFNGEKPRKVYTLTMRGLQSLQQTSYVLAHVNRLIEVKVN